MANGGIEYDGVLAQKVKIDLAAGVVDVGLAQPGRNAILEFVQERRNSRALKKTDGVRLALTIPVLDYEVLCRTNPALRSRDGTERRNAWEKFIRSDESSIYRAGSV